MTTTRRRLLQLLHKQTLASAADLARALKLSAADVRRHLANLQEDRLIEFAGLRPNDKRGRPERLFRLTRALVGDNIDLLAGAALWLLLDGLSEPQRESALRSLAERLAGPPVQIGVPGARRLGEAVNRLNELHYQARWEARPDGPRVFLGQCPYAAVIARHPELCRMDAFLLQNQLGQPVEQVDRLAQSAQGAVFCSFRGR